VRLALRLQACSRLGIASRACKAPGLGPAHHLAVESVLAGRRLPDQQNGAWLQSGVMVISFSSSAALGKLLTTLAIGADASS